MKSTIKALFIVSLLLFTIHCNNKSTGPVAAGSSDQGNALTGVMGRVVYPDSTPARNANVVLHDKTSTGQSLQNGTSSLSLQLEETTTDSTGHFRFAELLPGDYILEIHDTLHNGLLLSCRYPNFGASIRLPTDTLRPTGALCGQILPIESMNYAHIYAVILELSRYLYADAEGRFIFKDLPAGRYTLSIQSLSSDYSVIRYPLIDVRSGETTLIDSIQLLRVDSMPVDPEYVADTIAVRAILDSNNIKLSVKDVTWITNGRIIYFQCFAPIYRLTKEIGRLSQLQYLGVFSTRSLNLPPFQISPELGALTNLTEVEITQANLDTIPFAVTMLQKLEVLNLSGNKIISIPSHLFRCLLLRNLNLSNNLLQTIPENLGELTRLIRLDLSNNRIQLLPETFGTLTHLEALSLYSNQLSTLPVSIGEIVGLKQLSVIHNGLTELPGSFTGLTCAIDISFNRLCQMADSLILWTNTHYCPYFQCVSGGIDTTWRNTQTCP